MGDGTGSPGTARSPRWAGWVLRLAYKQAQAPGGLSFISILESRFPRDILVSRTSLDVFFAIVLSMDWFCPAGHGIQEEMI